MTDSNPIRKVPSGNWHWHVDTGRTFQGKMWVAVCPVCSTVLKRGANYGFDGTRAYTRKQAKDSLHRHLKQKHAGPGGYST